MSESVTRPPQEEVPADGTQKTTLSTVEEVYDFLHTSAGRGPNGTDIAIAYMRNAEPGLPDGIGARLAKESAERAAREALLPSQHRDGLGNSEPEKAAGPEAPKAPKKKAKKLFGKKP